MSVKLDAVLTIVVIIRDEIQIVVGGMAGLGAEGRHGGRLACHIRAPAE